MNPVVVDASLAGAWILPDEDSAAAEKLLIQALEEEVELSIPDLWTYEILNLLIGASRRGRIELGQINQALDLIEQLPVIFYDHGTSLSRSRTAVFARRFNLSAYDAAYLELADRLQAPLKTFDEALLRAAQDLGLCSA